jgi:hypothetical protein
VEVYSPSDVHALLFFIERVKRVLWLLRRSFEDGRLDLFSAQMPYLGIFSGKTLNSTLATSRTQC